MHPQQRSLALVNVLGGAAVLGSYLIAFGLSPELRSGLWGGVPEGLRPLYTVCMLLAAAGYFPFTGQLVFATSPTSPLPVADLPYRTLHGLYALVLLPSALWLPLTARLLEAPSDALWLLVRWVLVLVGLGSTGLLVVLVAMARQRGGLLAWCSVLGVLPFWVQTALLDAVVWPAYFPR